MEPVKIPRRIDEPPNILLWTVDELAPPMLGLFIGVLIGHAIPCAFVGLLLTNVYKRYRDGHTDGYFLHILYWVGWQLQGRCWFNPFIREYLP